MDVKFPGHLRVAEFRIVTREKNRLDLDAHLPI